MGRRGRGDLRARDGVGRVLRAGRAGVARERRRRAHAVRARAGAAGAAARARRRRRRRRRAREQVIAPHSSYKCHSLWFDRAVT